MIGTVTCRKSNMLCMYCHRLLELLINVKAQECVQSFNCFFFYRGVQALATLSRLLKMCYFGRHITPLLDATKVCGRPAVFC
jgi:hypothetical protein